MLFELGSVLVHREFNLADAFQIGVNSRTRLFNHRVAYERPHGD